MRKSSIMLLVVCAFDMHRAFSYELATHGIITYEAYKNSIVFDIEAMGLYGISQGAVPFGDNYYELSFAGPVARDVGSSEFKIINTDLGLGAELLSLAGWLMRGAIREDDYPKLDAECAIPPINPPTRPFNHFFDPYYRRPLTVAGEPRGDLAPTWAMGSVDAFADPETPVVGRVNHYTWFDAQEAMYHALTGRKRSNAAQPNVSGSDEVGPVGERINETISKAYWATTFRALGNVVHLVEDMAQPQHTRNEQYPGLEIIGGTYVQKC